MTERGKVAIVAHHGQENLGDETATHALVQNLRRLNPGGQIICFSMNPADTERRFGVAAFAVRPVVHAPSSRAPGEAAGSAPITDDGVASPPPGHSFRQRLKGLPGVVAAVGQLRRARDVVATLAREIAFIPRAQRHLRGTTLLIVAGSNQLLDLWGGPWGYPYTLLRWVIQARLAGAQVAFVSIGAGPIRHPRSWWFIRRALGLSSYVSFRDPGSLQLVRQHGARVPDAVVRPDMAYSHEEFRNPLRQGIATGIRTIAINPMPVNDPRYWPEADEAAYRRYVQSLADVALGLTRRDFRVVLFSTQPTDELVADDVCRLLPTGTAIEIVRPREPAELAACIRRADVVVATRFHGILFAIACRRPVIGISYYRKSRELMAAAGMDEFVVEIDQTDARWCLGAIERLLEESPSVMQRLRAHSEAQIAELERQYVDLVARWAPRLARPSVVQGERPSTSSKKEASGPAQQR